jgi:MFS family permease
MKSRALLPLFWLMLFDTASYTIRFPVLTLVFYDHQSRLFAATTTLVTRSWWYGVCMACYWLGSIIAAPVLSTWSDYAGRKKILVFGSIGTFVFAACTALGVMWGMLSLLLLGSLVGGLCTRLDPIAQAAVGDMGSAEQKMRNMSFLQLFIAIGAFFGPIIGGYFAHETHFKLFNFSLPFFIAAGLALCGLFIMLSYFRETLDTTVRPSLNKYANFKAVILNKQVLIISIILILMQLSWSTYYQFIGPIVKKDFNFSGIEIGFFMGMIAFWLALASAFFMPYATRFLSAMQIIRYSAFAVLFGLIGTMLLVIFPHIVWLRYLTWVFAIPIAAGDVMSYCAIITLYSNAVAKTAQGQVMGANFIIVSIVWMSTAFIGGVLMGHHAALPLIFALLGISSLIVLHKRIVL